MLEKTNLDGVFVVLDDLAQSSANASKSINEFSNAYNDALPPEFICNKPKSQCNHCGRCSTKSRKWVGMNKGRKKKRRK